MLSNRAIIAWLWSLDHQLQYWKTSTLLVAFDRPISKVSFSNWVDFTRLSYYGIRESVCHPTSIFSYTFVLKKKKIRPKQKNPCRGKQCISLTKCDLSTSSRIFFTFNASSQFSVNPNCPHFSNSSVKNTQNVLIKNCILILITF